MKPDKWTDVEVCFLIRSSLSLSPSVSVSPSILEEKLNAFKLCFPGFEWSQDDDNPGWFDLTYQGNTPARVSEYECALRLMLASDDCFRRSQLQSETALSLLERATL